MTDAVKRLFHKAMGTLTGLKERELTGESTPLEEDMRRMGLVLMGGGLLAVILDAQWIGLGAAIIGLILSFLGLTRRPDE